MTAAMDDDPAPDLAERLRQVEAAIRARAFPQAMTLAREALDRGLLHPRFLHLRSTWLEGRGRPLAALADLEQAHALDPSGLAVLMALAQLHTKLGRPLEALHTLQAAARLRPDLAGPYFELGWAAEGLGQIDQARQAYGEALRLDPRQARAAARLASIAAQQGEWEQARSLAEQALDIDPRQTPAHLALARAHMEQGALPAAQEQLGRLLVEPTLSPQDRYLTLHMLGDLRHRQARPAEAFAAWSAGSEAARREHAPRFSQGRSAPDVVHWLTEHFRAESPWPPTVSATAISQASGHVFLLGFPRSGTTLLEQVLAAHPQVVTMEEKEVLDAAVHAFQGSPGGLDALRDASEEDLAPFRESYWRQVAAYGLEPMGKVFIDKSPFNTLRLPLIARLFPHARVLFAVRDPRDVILSCFRTAFRTNAITFEFLDIAAAGRFYDGYMSLAEVYREKLPLALLTTRHEDILDDFEGEVGRICAFLDLGWRPEMKEFASRAGARAIATPSAHQLRRGLSRAGAGQWRGYEGPLEPALAALRPWVRRFGYGD